MLPADISLFDKKETILNRDQGYVMRLALQYTFDYTFKGNLADIFGHDIKLLYYNTNKLGKSAAYTAFQFGCDLILGLITTDMAAPVATWLSLFNVGVISTGATSSKLSNHRQYPYFSRTIPADYISAKVFVDIAKIYNWEYVSVLYTDNEDGTSLKIQFEEQMNNNGLCIKADIALAETTTKDKYKEKLIEGLNIEKTNVIFLFLSPKGCYSLFEAARNISDSYKNKLRNKQLVLSSNCGTMIPIDDGITQYFDNLLTIQPVSNIPKGFEAYVKSGANGKSRDIELRRYWRQYQGCDATDALCKLNNHTKFNRHVAITPMVNALERGLKAMKLSIAKYCSQYHNTSEKLTECKETLPYAKETSEKLKKYTAEFAVNGQNIFDEHKHEMFTNDSTTGDFDIFKFVKPNDSYEFQKIGYWSYKKWLAGKSHLTINFTSNESICTPPCPSNMVKEYSLNSKCCWSCKLCPVDNIIVNNTCTGCKEGSKANDEQSQCTKLPVYQMDPLHWLSIVIIVVSIMGFLLAFFILVVYLKNYSCKIIKASSRELALCSLGGLVLMLLTPLSFIQKPSEPICGVQKIIFGLSLTLCYAPLVLKTNRIHRIFVSSQKFKLKRLVLVSITSQFLLIAGMVGIQTVMGIFWILTDSPAIITVYPVNQDYGMIKCQQTGQGVILNIIYPASLMIASTFWAFKTRHLPESFSEIKSIGVTMYITLFTGTCALALTFLFAGIGKEEFVFSEIYVLCFTYQCIVVVTLIGQYAMKVKIIYSNPDFDAETDVTDFSQVTINNYRMTSPSLDMRKITIKPDGPDCTFNNNNIHNDKDNKERALSSSSSKTDSVTELDVKRVSIELP